MYDEIFIINDENDGEEDEVSRDHDHDRNHRVIYRSIDDGKETVVEELELYNNTLYDEIFIIHDENDGDEDEDEV